MSCVRDMFVPVGYLASRVTELLQQRTNANQSTPLGGTILMVLLLSAVLLVSWIMGRIEGRTIADYGLPGKRAFCAQFWQGAVLGFVSLAALLLVLKLAGAFSFGSPVLHGWEACKYGVAWTVPLSLSALLEDFFYRGYL